MDKHISWRFPKERRNQTRPAFLFLKDIINLIPAKLTWGGATAKFNTRKIYLEGATAKFNTRETQKFRGFLEPRNLVPAKFSTFKVSWVFVSWMFLWWALTT